MAMPDNHRKRHSHPTPQVGGLAILAGLTVWLIGDLIVLAPPASATLLSILLSAVGLGAVGLVDDQRDLLPVLRIILLLIFVGVAFGINSDLISPTLNWSQGVETSISIWLYLPLMCLSAIGLVNSINMADGQNGLVGSMFIVWSACLLIVSSGLEADVSAILLALCLIFLVFNIRGRIFLGDCGSYGVTFALGLLVTIAHAKHQLSLESIIVWFFIPVVDCLRLVIARPLQGRSVFDGGRDHFHHLLMDALGPRSSAYVYIGAVAVSSLLATVFPEMAIIWLCGLCAFYFAFANIGAARAANPEVLPDLEAAKVLTMDPRRDQRGAKS
jgi:UDP-GlcNAc:undecaprenyl-phosphate GlcNAc-1-phosphate transferase